MPAHTVATGNRGGGHVREMRFKQEPDHPCQASSKRVSVRCVSPGNGACLSMAQRLMSAPFQQASATHTRGPYDSSPRKSRLAACTSTSPCLFRISTSSPVIAAVAVNRYRCRRPHRLQHQTPPLRAAAAHSPPLPRPVSVGPRWRRCSPSPSTTSRRRTRRRYERGCGRSRACSPRSACRAGNPHHPSPATDGTSLRSISASNRNLHPRSWASCQRIQHFGSSFGYRRASSGMVSTASLCYKH
jgi:hypothetical protein